VKRLASASGHRARTAWLVKESGYAPNRDTKDGTYTPVCLGDK
jgi:hypothetical protein